MKKTFENFNKHEIEDICGLPSGQVVEVTSDELEELEKMKLVKFVAFSEELDDLLPLYKHCFKDEDLDKVMEFLHSTEPPDWYDNTYS